MATTTYIAPISVSWKSSSWDFIADVGPKESELELSSVKKRLDKGIAKSSLDRAVIDVSS